MNKRESEAFAEKESNYGKVFKVAGPCKFNFLSFLLNTYSLKILVVVAENMSGAKMYELVIFLYGLIWLNSI